MLIIYFEKQWKNPNEDTLHHKEGSPRISCFASCYVSEYLEKASRSVGDYFIRQNICDCR